jgi:hypothetical protein
VLRLFFQEDLSGIARLLEEKKRLAARIQHVQAFIRKWEFAESRLLSQEKISNRSRVGMQEQASPN